VKVISIVEVYKKVAGCAAAHDQGHEAYNAKCNVGHGVEVAECWKQTSASPRKARTTPPKMPLLER
jgi:nickel-dependent lactate racemase